MVVLQAQPAQPEPKKMGKWEITRGAPNLRPGFSTFWAKAVWGPDGMSHTEHVLWAVLMPSHRGRRSACTRWVAGVSAVRMLHAHGP